MYALLLGNEIERVSEEKDIFWYLKEYLLCLIVIKTCKYKGLVLLTILNVSMAIVLIRLIFKVGNLDFVKSSSYVLSVSS